MIIRNERGITLISLMITLVILVIITSVAISKGISVSGSANFQNIESYMLLIQTKCEYISNELVIGENPDVKRYGKEIASGEYAGWYELSQSELDDIGVKGAKARERILC